MTRPHVVLHCSVSLDGCTSGFAPDIGLHYALAARFECDVHLAGSDTILAMSAEAPPETDEDMTPPTPEPGDARSLLVIPDSRGRVRIWRHLRRQPFWRDAIAICTRTTPATYLEYLAERRIDALSAGDDRVDFAVALALLAERYDAKRVLADSGGRLNAVLLAAGLVDELSLVIAPTIVGRGDSSSLVNPPEGIDVKGATSFRLSNMERVGDGAVWLRYDVVHA